LKSGGGFELHKCFIQGHFLGVGELKILLPGVSTLR